ncbi:hypothetical protein L3Q82_018467 [Scortum barcoo]|uniref:Uncharacterized protein n=1 Tax=Scortum barcoo TaxID=214431 RepID=A0ACB8VFP0_9TELE|nr:hypothetical protein L3Q82_018467 [Scortum barcoo]
MRPSGRRPGADPGHAGGIISLDCLGKRLGIPLEELVEVAVDGSLFGRKSPQLTGSSVKRTRCGAGTGGEQTKHHLSARHSPQVQSSTVDLKTKEEKDAELDRRIEALRKKNEALVKRYQEIEEDKKKAEQEGIAVTTPRKPRPHEPETDRRKTEKENFTVTVDLSKVTGEKRVVNEWKSGAPRGRKTSEESDGHGGQNDGHSPPRRTGSGRVGRGGQRGGGGRQERREREPRTPRDGEAGESGGQGGQGGQGRRGGRKGRGGGGGGGEGGRKRRRRRRDTRRHGQEVKGVGGEEATEHREDERRNGKNSRPDGDKPIRNFLDDPRRSGPAPDTDRKEGSRRHVRNWGGLDFDNVKTGAELEKEWTSRRPGPKGSIDMTMSMTGRERAEYLRWKKEREQIDEERLARHRNATGQWRREWDAQKTENMFKEDPYAAAEGITPEQGSRRGEFTFKVQPGAYAPPHFVQSLGAESQTHFKPLKSFTEQLDLFSPSMFPSDDSKRPPKAPTFGDFLSGGRSQGPRGERGRGRGRGQKPSYSLLPLTLMCVEALIHLVFDSMHDNRWEGEKDEEDKEKREEKTKKKEKEKEEEKPKPPTAQKVGEKNGGEEDDDEEWEDASDGEEDEEDESDSEHDSRGDEKKDKGKEKPSRSKAASSTSAAPRSRPKSAGSPKEQRTPRPKVHIPPPTAVQESPEGGKPLSPFSPLDSHQPVSDWGEAMEMLSPRSSMGESPLKPPSVEASPPQKKEEEKEKEEEIQPASSDTPAETQKEENTAVSSPSEKTEALQMVVVSESESVPTDSAAAAPCDPTLSDVTEVAVTTEQDTPAARSEDKLDPPPSAAPPEADQSSSEPAGGKVEDSAPAEANGAPTAEAAAEQTSSGAVHIGDFETVTMKLLETIRLTSEEDGETRRTESITLLISGATVAHQTLKITLNHQEEKEGLCFTATGRPLRLRAAVVFVSCFILKRQTGSAPPPTRCSLTVPSGDARSSLPEFSLPGAHRAVAGFRHRRIHRRRRRVAVRSTPRPHRSRGHAEGGPPEPDSDEPSARDGNGSGRDTEMKAAGRQISATDKLNGDTKRRPSYPGELRAKHANMSAKIWVKVAMAVTYFLCVSVAAVILVIYYVFFWTPDTHSNSTGAPNRTDCLQTTG